MFNRLSLKAGLLSLAFLGSSAHAGFVSIDWQVEGDNKVALHEETGIEWMKHSVTRSTSLASVEAQTGVGGIYENWRLPTFAEVTTMMSAFPAPRQTTTSYGASSTDASSDYSSLNNTMNLFFGTFQSVPDNSGRYATFFHRADSGSIVRSGFRLFYGQYSKVAIRYLGHSGGLGGIAESVFLVNDGGISISSIQNPSLNVNNAEAPVNSVSTPIGLGAGFLALGLLRLRRKMSHI